MPSRLSCGKILDERQMHTGWRAGEVGLFTGMWYDGQMWRMDERESQAVAGLGEQRLGGCWSTNMAGDLGTY